MVGGGFSLRFCQPNTLFERIGLAKTPPKPTTNQKSKSKTKVKVKIKVKVKVKTMRGCRSSKRCGLNNAVVKEQQKSAG